MLEHASEPHSFSWLHKYSIVHIYHIFLIHPSVDGHLDCFYLLGVVNNAAVNIRIQLSVLLLAFSSFGIYIVIATLMVEVVSHGFSCISLMQF